jgi:hypothetical protein
VYAQSLVALGLVVYVRIVAVALGLAVPCKRSTVASTGHSCSLIAFWATVRWNPRLTNHRATCCRVVLSVCMCSAASDHLLPSAALCVCVWSHCRLAANEFPAVLLCCTTRHLLLVCLVSQHFSRVSHSSHPCHVFHTFSHVSQSFTYFSHFSHFIHVLTLLFCVTLLACLSLLTVICCYYVSTCDRSVNSALLSVHRAVVLFSVHRVSCCQDVSCVVCPTCDLCTRWC